MSKKNQPSSNAASETVKVCIRCRPLNNKEMNEGNQVVVQMQKKSGEIFVKKPYVDEPPKQFTFDLVYDWNSN